MSRPCPTGPWLGKAPITIDQSPSGLLAASAAGCIARLAPGDPAWTLVPGTEGLCNSINSVSWEVALPPQVLTLSQSHFLIARWPAPHKTEVLRVEGARVAFECAGDPSLQGMESVAVAGNAALRGYGRLITAERALYRFASGQVCPWRRTKILDDLIGLNGQLLPAPRGKGVLFVGDHGRLGGIEEGSDCRLLVVTGIEPEHWADLESIVRLDADHFLVASRLRRFRRIVKVESAR